MVSLHPVWYEHRPLKVDQQQLTSDKPIHHFRCEAVNKKRKVITNGTLEYNNDSSDESSTQSSCKKQKTIETKSSSSSSLKQQQQRRRGVRFLTNQKDKIIEKTREVPKFDVRYHRDLYFSQYERDHLRNLALFQVEDFADFHPQSFQKLNAIVNECFQPATTTTSSSSSSSSSNHTKKAVTITKVSDDAAAAAAAAAAAKPSPMLVHNCHLWAGSTGRGLEKGLLQRLARVSRDNVRAVIQYQEQMRSCAFSPQQQEYLLARYYKSRGESSILLAQAIALGDEQEAKEQR